MLRLQEEWDIWDFSKSWNTWDSDMVNIRATSLLRNLDLNNHHCLIFCLLKWAYNEPLYVLLCHLQFFHEYLTLSIYSSTIVIFIVYYHIIYFLVAIWVLFFHCLQSPLAVLITIWWMQFQESNVSILLIFLWNHTVKLAHHLFGEITSPSFGYLGSHFFHLLMSSCQW